MKISVIVPFQNEMYYLRDCLQSLEAQTFSDFQVILVGDFSTRKEYSLTSLKEELGEMKLSLNLELVELVGKAGVAASRNLGLSMAKGEYVYFLDCDDYILEDTFEKMLCFESDMIYAPKTATWFKREYFLENRKDVDRVTGMHKETFKGDCSDAALYLFQKEKNMHNVSALSMLIRRELLVEHGILFQEAYLYSADYLFVADLLEVIKTSDYASEGLYIKRKHNDPIHMPSLSQTKEKLAYYSESLDAYKQAVERTSTTEQVRIAMERQFAFNLTQSLAAFVLQAEEKQARLLFEQFKPLCMKLSQEGRTKKKLYGKTCISRACNKEFKDFYKVVKFHASLQTFKRLTKSRVHVKKYVYKKFFVKKPLLKKTVMLESFFGKSYSDSPKYIFEYLNKTFPGKYDYVWVLNKKTELPYPAKQVKRCSFRFFYYMARAKYMVFNSRQPEYFVKRKGNVFLETWHGTPLKKLVFDMDEVTSASPLYKQQFYNQGRSWDYLVSPNEFCTEVFRRAFMYENQLLEFGYPRNDLLHRPDKEKVADGIKTKLGIPLDKKVILYAPTWRDDEYYGPGQYKFTLQLELDKLREKLEKDYVVLLRTHYFVADALDLSGQDGFAYNLSKYDDIAELYLISDILITDYSSVFFDYANLKRPMLFFTYDLEKYRDTLRGFYIDMEHELPGPLLFTTQEIIETIENIEQVEKKYQDKYEVFYEKYCGWEDGHASENIVNAVFKDE